MKRVILTNVLLFKDGAIDMPQSINSSRKCLLTPRIDGSYQSKNHHVQIRKKTLENCLAYRILGVKQFAHYRRVCGIVFARAYV
jgi:hypothetical protein